LPAWSSSRDARPDGKEELTSPAGIDERGSTRHATHYFGKIGSRGDGALVLHRRISISCSNAAVADSSEANRASKSSHSYVRAEIATAEASAAAKRRQATPTISQDGMHRFVQMVPRSTRNRTPWAVRSLPDASGRIGSIAAVICSLFARGFTVLDRLDCQPSRS
jgi:hypothetical protein